MRASCVQPSRACSSRSNVLDVPAARANSTLPIPSSGSSSAGCAMLTPFFAHPLRDVCSLLGFYRWCKWYSSSVLETSTSSPGLSHAALCELWTNLLAI